MTVYGTTAAGFETLRDAFGDGQAKDSGGAQLCVYRHGRKVVDLWTGRCLDGSADEEAKEPLPLSKQPAGK